MNTPSGAVPELGVGSQRIAPALSSATRPMYWSVRRELWENRSVYIAPLVVAGVVLFASLINIMVRLPGRMETLPTLDPARQHAALVKPFSIAPAPIMLATLIVGIFYCLDALNGERRDRSILFWKSMPVSDRTTVLSKASIPLVVLPLIGLVLGVAVQRIMLLAGTAVLAANGMSSAPLWEEFRFFQGLLVNLYGLTVHVLWFAPVYCYLLLVSAWARRAVFLWAFLPLLAVSAVERIIFGTQSFMRMLQYRLTGAMSEGFVYKPKPGSHEIVDQITQLDPGRFLTRPGLWSGLLFAVAFLAIAVRLRRDREPI